MRKFFTFFCFTLLYASAANCQLFLDNFNYSTGNLVGNGSWAQTSTTSTNPIQITASGLPYTGYPGASVGNGVALGSAGGQDVYNSLSSSVTSGSLYCSFLLNVSSAAATGDYFLHFESTAGTTSGFYGKVFAKSSASGFVIGASKNGTATYGSTVFSFSTTYVVVLKYTYNTSTTTDDAVSVYVFNSSTIPTSEAAAAAEVSNATDAITDPTTLGGIALRQGSSTASPAVTVDGIHVDVSWLQTLADKWTGTTSNFWTNASNWNCGVVPTSSDNVLIPSGTTNSPSYSSFSTISSLTINSGATLTNSGFLTVSNALDNSGTISAGTINVGGSLTNNGTVGTYGTIVLNGSSAQTISGTGSIDKLTLSNSSGATISSGTTTVKAILTLQSGTLTTGGHLTLASTATQTAALAAIDGVMNAGSISGNVTVQRYLKTNSGGYGSRRFWLLTAPMDASGNVSIQNSWQQQIHVTGTGSGGTGVACTSGATGSQPGTYSNGFDITTANISSAFYYNDFLGSGSKWVPYSGTAGIPLKAGFGGRILVRGDRTVQGCALLYTSPPAPSTDVVLSATGKIQTGTLTLTAAAFEYYSPAGGYNLLGNPYPSEFDFSAFQATNSGILNQYWTYYPINAAGTYSNYNAGTLTNFPGGYSNGSIIASGQAFFVQNGASTVSSITFNEAHKSSTTQYGLFGVQQPLWKEKLRIGLMNNSNQIDEVVVRFGSQVKDSKAYDMNWDSKSLNEGNVFIQTIKQNNKLAIQTRNVNFISDTVQLNIQSIGSANFSLNFSEFDEVKYADIYLIDKYTNTTQKINDNPVYQFNVNLADSASQGSNRFSVVFKSTKTIVALIDNTADVTNITAYPNPVVNELTINSKNIINTVRLVNAAGVVSISKSNINNTQAKLNVSKLLTGIYMAEVIDVNGNKTTLKVIK